MNLFKLLILCVLIFSVSVVLAQDNDDDPVQLFNAGQTAHEKGEFEIALGFYQKAIEIASEFPEAYFQSGNALLSLKRPTEAEKAFRTAIELRPDWTLPMTSLGILLVNNDQFEEAERILLKVIDSKDDNPAAYSAMIELRIKTGAKTEVLKTLLTRAQYLTSKPNPSASIWAARAALERSLNDKRAALISLERALLIDPLNISALTERAELALSEGDYSIALKDAEKLKEIAPESANNEFLWARIYAGKGDLERSLEILNSIKNPRPEMSGLRDKIIYISSSNIEELELKLESDKNNSALLGRLCRLLRTEDPARALEYCRRASEAEPENLDHAIGFGAALVQSKRYTDAIALFKKLLEYSPENFAVHTNLATAYFQIERYQEAKSEYRWILKKQPDLAIGYYLLGIAHDRLGEYIDALANYQQFLKVADSAKNSLEIEKVNLRLPGLEKMVKSGKGKKNE